MASFRMLLLELSNSLTNADLRELKYVCSDQIPAGKAETMERPFELFIALEQMNLLSGENRDFLAAKLAAINRNDLRNKLLGITEEVKQTPVKVTPSEERLELQNKVVSDHIIHDIVEGLSTSWKMLGRRLRLEEAVLRNVDAENHKIMEKGIDMLNTWKERKGNEATVEELRRGLEAIHRRDLSEKVRDTVNQEQEALLALAVKHGNQDIVNEKQQAQLTPAAEHGHQAGLPFEETQPLVEIPPNQRRQPQEQAELSQRSRHVHQLRTPVQPEENNSVQAETRPFPRLDDLDPVRHIRQPNIPSPVQPPEEDIVDSGLAVNPPQSVPVQVESGRGSRLTVDGNYLDPEKYKAVDFIGKGGFAKVYLCVKKDTRQLLAVKMIDLGMNGQEVQNRVDDVQKEVKILSSLNSPYIVKFFYSEECHNTLLIFLEYMPGGSMYSLLQHKGALQEDVVKKYARQILMGVEFLHNRGIIHRDIKGANVLLDKAQENTKITDFGISKKMDKLATSTGGLKTNTQVVACFYWTSPELLDAKTFRRNTDIWSVGCTVVEMLTKYPPLYNQDLDRSQVMCKILQHDVQPPENCSSVAYGFLEKCFFPMERRPSARELLDNDPFLQW